MLYVSFALSQGALALSQGAYPYSKSKDTTIIRIIKGFFGFLGEILGQARNEEGAMLEWSTAGATKMARNVP